VVVEVEVVLLTAGTLREIVIMMEESLITKETEMAEMAVVLEVVQEVVAIIAVSLDTFLENVLTKRLAEVGMVEVEIAEDQILDLVLVVAVITAVKKDTFPENVLKVDLEAEEIKVDQVVEIMEKEVAVVLTVAKKDTFPENVLMPDLEAVVEAVIDLVGVVEIEKGVILVEIPVISQEIALNLLRTSCYSCD